ncbi:MAG: YlmC/YmxH family sporulation protein [Clostridiales bacterium]|jgi:YlmC/YmxH family sporulation protein|nr:YlmC/YmxH family sporulation protein [Clostridiales bacterium]
MLIKVSEMKDMEVVSLHNGRRLGPIMDIEMDLDEGRILALILPEEPVGGFSALFRSAREFWIAYEQIYRIGEDVILVDVTGELLTPAPAKPGAAEDGEREEAGGEPF